MQLTNLNEFENVNKALYSVMKGVDNVSEQESKKSMEVFKHYIWDKFGQPSIDDFGTTFCKELLFGENAAKPFMLKLLINYHALSLRYQYVEMLYKQVLMLGLEDTMKKDLAELDELLDTFLAVKENQ